MTRTPLSRSKGQRSRSQGRGILWRPPAYIRYVMGFGFRVAFPRTCQPISRFLCVCQTQFLPRDAMRKRGTSLLSPVPVSVCPSVRNVRVLRGLAEGNNPISMASDTYRLCFLMAESTLKCVAGRGSAPNPVWGVYNAPQTP